MERKYLRKRIVLLFWSVLFVSLMFCFLSLRSRDMSEWDNADKLRESVHTNRTHRGNWTVLLTVNNAYFDFFRNWYWAYQQLNITYSIIVVAEDEFVYRKLREFKSETVSLTRSGHESVQESASYGSAAFSTLVSARPSHILNYLKMGINVLYSDIDMVWIQNPFPFFTGDFDMWMELDSVDNYCTGLMAIKSNTNSVKLIEDWEKSLQETFEIDQTAFNKVVKNATIRLSILDSSKFPSGDQYFEQFTDEERNLAVVVHNNWINGQDAKLNRFINMKLWFVPAVHFPTEFHYVMFVLVCIILFTFICEAKAYY